MAKSKTWHIGGFIFGRFKLKGQANKQDFLMEVLISLEKECCRLITIIFSTNFLWFNQNIIQCYYNNREDIIFSYSHREMYLYVFRM